MPSATFNPRQRLSILTNASLGHTRQRRALRQDRLQRVTATRLRLRRDGRAAAQPHRLQLRRRIVCVVVDEGGEEGEREFLERLASRGSRVSPRLRLRPVPPPT